MGYRIDIDHGGCITCGICMDVCPVEALDMSRPDAPGVETGPGPGHPLRVDDGAPAPGRASASAAASASASARPT